MNIKNILEMDRFTNFKLIAGQKGLSNNVSKICLLDYEIVNRIEGQFLRDEFALTSLLGAKDNADLILDSVKHLVSSHGSGLAIKNIYYNTLPKEVLDYANDHNFPIFIFDNSVFFEDLIMDFRDVVNDLENSKHFEKRINRLINRPSNADEITDLFIDLTGLINKPYKVIYFSYKNENGNENTLKPIERFRSMKKESVRTLIKYNDGLLMIYVSTAFKKRLLAVDIDYIGIDTDAYWIGESDLFESSEHLMDGIHEALSASQIATAEKTEEVLYKNAGIYKLLLAPHNAELLLGIAKAFLDPVLDYDKKHGTELFITACSFIENDGNISRVSKDLFQHNNTIRYRINSLKKLHQMEDAEGSFYEQLSLAIKIMKLKGLYSNKLK